MLDFLIDLDKSLLLAINGWNNAFFDEVMFWISDRFVWIPFYVAMLYTLVRTRKWEYSIYAILLVPLVVLCADQFASGFCKPFFERFRPTHDPSMAGMVHLVHGQVSSLYGFISSHAANTCAIAMFMSLLLRNKSFQVMVFSWAFLNCYSRMYMGVHFPGDILCGAIAGLIIGALLYGVYYGIVRWRTASIQKKAKRVAHVNLAKDILNPLLMTEAQQKQLVMGTRITGIVYGLSLLGMVINAALVVL